MCNCNKQIARFTFDSPTVQDVAANGAIQFSAGTTASDCIELNGDVVSLRAHGTYQVHANFTTAAAAAGVEEIQMFRNGSAVAGAHALETVAAAGDMASVSFTALVTVGCGTTELSFRSVPATTVRVANVTIEKVG